MGIKARVMKTYSGALWIGQVNKNDGKGWKTVTSACFTKFGAKLELRQWKRDNCPEEFEL